MISDLSTARVQTPGDREVVVTRAFRAPRELVWEAYTTPELMKQWLLGPPGWSMPVCEMDVRAGGSYRWEWSSDETGARFGFHGEFLEVSAPERIVSTETFDPGDVGGGMDATGAATVTVSLEARDGSTVMTTHIEYPSPEARDGAIGSGMTDGMEASYENLDGLLAARAT